MRIRPLAASLVLASALTISAVEPPPMPKRSISPGASTPAGTKLQLNDRGSNFTLYLPRGWNSRPTNEITACLHFHTVDWFAIQEHERRGATAPLIVFNAGEGSAAYRLPFEDTNRLARIVSLVEAQLPGHPRIKRLEISSFSAGYGAVRELLKNPDAIKRIQRIALFDSMYAGLEVEPKGATNRRPSRAQIEVWVPFAQAAVRREKEFVFTHSDIPTRNYASSFECAQALIQRLGLTAQLIPATGDDYSPRSKTDAGNFHVWGYTGTDAQAHLTHIRHMADVLKILDSTH